MTAGDASAFELLEALRAIAAAWWTRLRLTRIPEADRERLGWREARRLEESLFGRDELPQGYAWSVPTDKEVADAVLPPAEPSPTLRLKHSTLAQFFEGNVVRLLHVVTGDLRHFDDPVAWMRERGWCVYRRRIDGRNLVRFSAARAGAWRVIGGDPSATLAFHRLCAEAWEAYLVATEWELAMDVDGGRHGYPMRSPSGMVYPLDRAVDVALARGGFDGRAELARGSAAAERALARSNATERRSPA